METYKQDIKEKAREEIWKHAIRSLTSNRNESKVISEDYIRDAWDYINFKCQYTKDYFATQEIDVQYLNDWVDFSERLYNSKRASDLKVVYLCGPEPENDLNVMIKYGIKIENVWAIESKENIYKRAIESVRERYINLKIFHGNIKDFFEIYNYKFDIIYLDFISPIFSKDNAPFNVIHNLLDEGNLNDLGILITNYPLPDSNEDDVTLMCDFFFDNKHVDGRILGQKNTEGENVTWFSDGVSVYGYTEEQFKQILRDNFNEGYSALCSLYPIFYSNVILPRYKVANKNSTFKMLYQSKETAKKILEKQYEECFFFCEQPELGFVNRIKKYKDGKIRSSYFERENGKTYSRYEAAKLATILCNFEEYYVQDIFSEDFLNSFRRTFNSIKEHEKLRLFCDVLLHNDLFEVAINQLGMVYHTNIDNHRRFKYTAKTRTMYLDVLTFDTCRAFYDWMPLFEFYDKNMENINRQLLFRCCLDAIGKKLNFTPIPIYDSGVSMIGMYETEWAVFTNELPERIIIQ